MRAMWKGALSFGLINIPISLYSAIEDRGGLSFDMLHKKDLSPIRYAKICKEDGKEIPYSEIVKGYKYENGDYVVLVDEDFKKADVKKSKAIEILDFVDEKRSIRSTTKSPIISNRAKGPTRLMFFCAKPSKNPKKLAWDALSSTPESI